MLRQLHSPYLLHTRVAKELLFMVCAPSCLTTTSVLIRHGSGSSLAEGPHGVTTSGLASPGHLPRFGGGLWEFGFSALDEW
ncbi:MAG TPA: hypothetical protein PKX12_13250 [Spirochaetota bacterium]|nr:hypothetical protein [Spirochaetota bacterium]